MGQNAKFYLKVEYLKKKFIKDQFLNSNKINFGERKLANCKTYPPPIDVAKKISEGGGTHF